MTRYKQNILVFPLLFTLSGVDPVQANGIAQSITNGLSGGTGLSRNLSNGGLLSSGVDNKHKLGKVPSGLPKLLRADYDEGDQVVGFGQRAKIIKPDGRWVLLTYHGRWQARKLYSDGRRVDLNRETGEVFFDSRRPTATFAGNPRAVVSSAK